MVGTMGRIALIFLSTLHIFTVLGYEECYTPSEKSEGCKPLEICVTNSTTLVPPTPYEAASNYSESSSQPVPTTSKCSPPNICCPVMTDSLILSGDATETWESAQDYEEVEEFTQKGEDCGDGQVNCSEELAVLDEPFPNSNNSNHNFSNTSLVGKNSSNETVLSQRSGFGDFGSQSQWGFYPEPLFSTPQQSPFEPPDVPDTQFIPAYLNANLGNAKNLLPAFCGLVDPGLRIVGGSVTLDGEVPWIVALLYDTKSQGIRAECGGSIITDRYVLTAAHCVKGRVIPATWVLTSVRLGSKNIGYNKRCSNRPSPIWGRRPKCPKEYTDLSITRKIVHEQYDPALIAPFHDIAILLLSQPVIFTHTVRPICLPDNPTISPKLTTAGWGSTESSPKSHELLKVDLPLADRGQCERKYNSSGLKLIPKQICAGGEVGRDSCTGDSGSPLWDTYGRSLDVYRIVGITSFGPQKCGTKDWPAVYTKVYDYVPWILEKIQWSNNAKNLGRLVSSSPKKPPKTNRTKPQKLQAGIDVRKHRR